jgi:hypothetical protein
MNDASFSETEEFECYRIAVPVEFAGGCGTTVEMSAHHVRFATAMRLAPGTLLGLTLRFRTDGVKVRAQARVRQVRVAADGASLAEVTAEFEEVSFG